MLMKSLTWHSAMSMLTFGIYRTPPLFFMHPNGTAEPVVQVGGILAYYQLLPFGSPDIKAFPPGFKMVAGDAFRRNWSLPLPVPEKSLWKADDMTQSALAQKAIGFNCLNYGAPNHGTLMTYAMPDRATLDGCEDGLRLELGFPSCWDGISKYSSFPFS
jgi:hypothetical protein